MTKGGASEEGHGLALWLVPEVAFADRAASVINDTAARNRLQAFAPHVTLLSGFKAPAETASRIAGQLARAHGPIEVTLGNLRWTQDYFRSFFVTISLTPGLADLRQAAEQAFAVGSHQIYEPHLSLAYGWDDEKAKALEAQRISAQAVQLSHKVILEGLRLVDCAGPVNRWHSVAEYRLDGSRLMESCDGSGSS